MYSVRVVYTSDVYDQKSKTWRYEFKAFVRAPIVMDYDPATRSGVVIGDLGLIGVPPDEASYKMKQFVISEMRAHSGAVESASGLSDVRVRFQEVKTDSVANIIQIGFNLPY